MNGIDQAGPVRSVPLPQACEIGPGRPHPLGAWPDAGGVNFSVFSEHGTGVELLLFEHHDSPEPYQVIRLDPETNRTFHFWHVYVKLLPPGAFYAFRVDGPWAPEEGHRFNRNKVLLDPYARGNTNTTFDRAAACGPEDNVATSLRSVVVDTANYDWEGDRPLERPMSESVIYEMHVRGFTASASSGVAHPGTFSGVIEKIPYLQDLGITAVELMPVFDFDEKEVIRNSPVTGQPLTNYWGYDPYAHFAPQSAYCIDPSAGSQLTEFRDMVKALHRAGIEVILDVVFNHTTEGNHQGPTLSFRGLDNSVYYFLVPGDRQYYMDYSGCGNTFNANHPIVEKFILECLYFWVTECHVDGFRFDEGSILSRGPDGSPMRFPPVVWEIELAEVLANTKVIAEAWDAAGLYQVGLFPGARWAEWNGRFRDDVRRFVRGDPGVVAGVASRIAGSADIYQAAGELPVNSVNFVTAHDGFTLNDVVSYNEKHNEANGEGNRDGVNDNMSWNCGVEGETDDPAVEELRVRQIKNFATILFLSQGVPMLLSGDEIRRTQRGNNNGYCQDNELTWFDWDLAEKNRDLFRFFKLIIDLRKRQSFLKRNAFFSGRPTDRGLPDIMWHGCAVGAPGWNDPNSHVLAFTVAGRGDEPDLHVMMNMDGQDLSFDLPTIEGRRWYRVADTAAQAPDDIVESGKEKLVRASSYVVRSHAVVVLIAKPPRSRAARPARATQEAS